MPSTSYAGHARFGLLPEPERNPGSIITSALINGGIIVLALILGSMVRHQVQLRKMDSMVLYVPTPPPPEVKIKVKMPPPPKIEVKPPVVKLEAPKINLPKVEKMPEPKPLPEMKQQAAIPKIQAAKPAVVLAPQPKAALTAAAPAVTPQAHPVPTQSALGELNGAKPNPNAQKSVVVAAVAGNPYGGKVGDNAVPRGVIGSTGIGNGTKSGSNAGTGGRVASAGLPGGNGTSNGGGYGNSGSGHVGSAGIQMATAAPASAGPALAQVKPATIPPVLLSHSAPEYTAEAKQLKIQGDVVLRVTINTAGEMIVLNVIHGLGHGLDEQAKRSAPTYKFKPAMQNGQPVEFTTNIIIKFQTA